MTLRPTHQLICVYRSNGLAERAVGETKRLLRQQKAITGKNEWSKALVRVTKNLNNAYNRVIKMTPAEAVRERKDQKTVEETNELLADAAYGTNAAASPLVARCFLPRATRSIYWSHGVPGNSKPPE